MREAATKIVDGRLYSCDYNDFYASKDAIEECQRVHIGPASLAERIAQTTTFTVFEFGLGAGINFLSIADVFLQHAPSGARLRFISTEANPLPYRILEQVVRDTASQLCLAEEWVSQYPPAVEGIHRRLFAEHRVELTMIYSSAIVGLTDFLERDKLGVDAWILDGFAPDRNPDMWTTELLGSLAQLSKEKATVTTYSSAGNVRRSLSQNGFQTTRVSNLPHKRHTTVATLAATGISLAESLNFATVIGGGFAGCATAHALARRGVQVELLTPSGQVADATSAIPTAIVHSRLSASNDQSPRFRLHSYTHSQSLIETLTNDAKRGALQFPNSRMSEQRLSDVADTLGTNWAQVPSQSEVRELSGFPIDLQGVYFPKSLIASGPALCNSLSSHPNIELVAKSVAQATNCENPTVFATGTHKPFEPHATAMEIAELEGQVDEFRPSTDLALPTLALLIDGYVAPSQLGLVAGSTYEYKPWPNGLSTATNLRRLVDVSGLENWIHVNSFRARRAITSDRLPVAGPLGSNLWVNIGHGSSGTTSAPYCGEILASLILGELTPAPQSFIDAIAPLRFERRQEKRPNPFLNGSNVRR